MKGPTFLTREEYNGHRMPTKTIEYVRRLDNHSTPLELESENHRKRHVNLVGRMTVDEGMLLHSTCVRAGKVIERVHRGLLLC
jgi:hypothetical protein